VNEHVEAGGVENVDLGLAPLGCCKAGRNRHLAADLFFVVVGDRVSFIDSAEPLGGTRREQHGGDK